jgi:hypothetical protein
MQTTFNERFVLECDVTIVTQNTLVLNFKPHGPSWLRVVIRHLSGKIVAQAQAIQQMSSV